MIPSDDEDGTGHRCSSHASSSNSQRDRVDKLRLTAEPVPSTAAVAAATWRAFNRPRMALAVLAVSLQHIAAHSDHLQYHHNRRQESVTKNDELLSSEDSQQQTQQQQQQQQPDETDEKSRVVPPPLPPVPVPTLPADVQTFSLDEGIEPDR